MHQLEVVEIHHIVVEVEVETMVVVVVVRGIDRIDRSWDQIVGRLVVVEEVNILVVKVVAVVVVVEQS